MNMIDRLPLAPLVFAAMLLGLAPLTPEPHVIEKLRMLFSGTLSRPIDIFDLLLHGTPWLLLFAKLGRMATQGGAAGDEAE